MNLLTAFYLKISNKLKRLPLPHSLPNTIKVVAHVGNLNEEKKKLTAQLVKARDMIEANTLVVPDVTDDSFSSYYHQHIVNKALLTNILLSFPFGPPRRLGARSWSSRS